MLREPACRDSAINVRPLKHAVVRAANRNKERIVERESDIQNFAGVAGVALALAALGHARVAIKLDLRGGGRSFFMFVNSQWLQHNWAKYQSEVIGDGEDVPTVAPTHCMHRSSTSHFGHQSRHCPAERTRPRVPRRSSQHVEVLHARL